MNQKSLGYLLVDVDPEDRAFEIRVEAEKHMSAVLFRVKIIM